MKPVPRHPSQGASACPAGRGPLASGARGFTLIEVMVVLVIMMIIGISVTSTFRTNIASYRIVNEANALSRDLQFARSEALKRGGVVGVCASTDQQNCSGSTTWTTGWIVFYNGNTATPYTASGAFTLATSSGDVVLRSAGQSSGQTTVTASNSTTGVVFNRQGSTSALAANPVLFTLHAPTSLTSIGQCVTIVPSGRTAVVSAGVGTCS